MTRGYMPKAKSVEWETPQDLYDELNNEFHFTLDPCASHDNAKCDRYYTIEDDGLSKSWANERVFMNPPYGKELNKWVSKAYFESLYAEIIVALLPVRTSTAWFHDYVLDKEEIRFIRGRLYFTHPDGHKVNAPFSSMIVIWSTRSSGTNGYLTDFIDLETEEILEIEKELSD